MIRCSLALVFLAACGGQPASHETTTPYTVTGPIPGQPSDPTCPLEMPGTSVAEQDTPDGGALVFITTGDPTWVRNSAATFVSMHPHPQPETFANIVRTPAAIDASNIEHGVRIEFSATKPDDVAALQSELRMHASHLTGSSCKMLM